MTRKRITFAVTVSVPDWMTKAQVSREVRSLINEQCNWMSAGPLGEPLDDGDIRAVAVKATKPPKARVTHRIRPCKGNRSAWLLVRLRDDGTEIGSYGSCVTALSVDDLLRRAGDLAPGRNDAVQIISNR